MNFIIEGGTTVTMGPEGTIKNSAIIIEDEKIIEVGKARALKRKHRRYEKIQADGKIVIPGLINTHHHAAMSILRGYADDLDLKTWLEKWVWPIEQHMTPQDIYAGALLTAIESIMGGITTINTMYHYTEELNEAQALSTSGIRGVIGHVCFSWRKDQDKKILQSLAKTWHNQENGRIRTSVDPHAPYTVDPEYMKELKMITRDLNEKHATQQSPIIRHMHIAETKDEREKITDAFHQKIPSGIVEYLDGLGVLSNDLVAAHCVHLTPRDISILQQRGVKVAHAPISNLKLGSGIAPLSQLISHNIRIGLGTDSSCSNNSSDMFEVRKITALLHKGINRDPTLLTTDQVLRMATINGAETLLWDTEIGSIEPEKKADIVIINVKKPHLTPIYRETSHIVYSMKCSDVETVLVNGGLVMENREITTVNVDKAMERVEKTQQRLLDDLKAKEQRK
jgi:5-methylthioadenosine/S-adenosylhomocysteine deaminase